MMTLFEEFRHITQALNEAGVDYAVVGALALAIHGVPRATADIDLLVRPEDVPRVMALVAPIGFTLPVAPMRFSNTGISIQRVSKVVGQELLTLDLLLVGEALEDVWTSRIEIQSNQGSLWVVSRAGLIAMKAKSSRLKDLADLKRLEGDDEGT